MTVRKIKSIGDIPYPIDVGTDALSPLLTAGAALGITGEATDSAAWLQRASTSDGPTTIRSIHGRTLVWNQLCNLSVTQNTTGLTVVDNGDGSVTVSGTSSVTEESAHITMSAIPRISGHKYLIMGCPTGGSASTYYMGFNTSQTDLGSGGIYTSSTTGNAMLRLEVRANGITFENTVITPQVFDLTAMFGAGSEPSTIEEFTALYPLPYYEYDAGSLLPVSMTGIETTGFNQWDEEWEVGGYDTSNGNKSSAATGIRSANMVPVMPSTQYYMLVPHTSVVSGFAVVLFYDADGAYLHSYTQVASNGMAFTVPSDAHYLTFYVSSQYGTTYKHDICINISDPTRNGIYEPHWHQTRTIPAGTLRGAGTVYDELTETERITRVGAVDWTSADWRQTNNTVNEHGIAYIQMTVGSASGGSLETYASWLKSNIDISQSSFADAESRSFAYNGKNLFYRYPTNSPSLSAGLADMQANSAVCFYRLETPTVTPIDPPLNMTYRTEQGGTERVMVPTGEQSAPPTIVAAQGYTAESLRDAALSAIAPVENGLASTNYGVGAYLVHAGQLCKVTTAIATGEAITIGTNVTATTVMAEVIALIAQ